MNRPSRFNYPALGLSFAVAACLAAARLAAADSKSAAATPSAPTARAASGANTGIEAFRIIGERNIFNPNRVGRTARAAAEPVAAPKGDAIALVGTMESEQGVRAFFDSPDAAFRKAVRAGDAIADFTVLKIAPDGVVLARDGKEVPVKVTQQLRRPEGGEWTVSGVDPTVFARPSQSAGPGASDSPPIPADASEVLKRLMEKRQKQLKQ